MIIEVNRIILGRPVLLRDLHPADIEGGEGMERHLKGFVDAGMGHSFFGVEVPMPARTAIWPVVHPVLLEPHEVDPLDDYLRAGVRGWSAMPHGLKDSPLLGRFSCWLVLECIDLQAGQGSRRASPYEHWRL